jgi:hypothetical protein
MNGNGARIVRAFARKPDDIIMTRVLWYSYGDRGPLKYTRLTATISRAPAAGRRSRASREGTCSIPKKQPRVRRAVGTPITSIRINA